MADPRPSVPGSKPGAAVLSWAGEPKTAPRRRRYRVATATAVALLVAGLGVAWLGGAGPGGAGSGTAARTGPVEEDRYSVDAVAQRYRALGATLLDGAVRCAPIDPGPGVGEVVGCTTGAWSVVLSTYRTAADLRTARAVALPPEPGSVRHAGTEQPDAAFVMDETATGTVRVFWDSTAPRPVSASVTTTALTLPDLLAFYDTRGSTAVPRAELPGPAFTSGRLWAFARARVLADRPECAPIPEWENEMTGSVDAVKCTYPDGTVLGFSALGTPEDAQRYRASYVDPYGAVPGTQRVGTWAPIGDPTRSGTLVEYVDTEYRESYLYFDDVDLRCFGLLNHPDRTQDQLRTFWAEHAFQEITAGTGPR